MAYPPPALSSPSSSQPSSPVRTILSRLFSNAKGTLRELGLSQGLHYHARRHDREGHACSGGVVRENPAWAHPEPLQLRHTGTGQGRDGWAGFHAGLRVLCGIDRHRHKLHRESFFFSSCLLFSPHILVYAGALCFPAVVGFFLCAEAQHHGRNMRLCTCCVRLCAWFSLSGRSVFIVYSLKRVYANLGWFPSLLLFFGH